MRVADIKGGPDDRPALWIESALRATFATTGFTARPAPLPPARTASTIARISRSAGLMASSRHASTILRDIAGGDARAAEELMPIVYQELRRLAQGYLRRERRDHTLAPTALVHEAFLRLVGDDAAWGSATHFKAIAAIAMQRVLVDHARARNREKRGAGWRKVTLDDAFQLKDGSVIDALALEDALARMRQLDERQARVAELRLYGGLSAAEAATLLDVAARTVERDWKMAVAWLRRELSEDRTEPAPGDDA
jgi:RNA polymerase sigma factor (TIGR02999 family)